MERIKAAHAALDRAKADLTAAVRDARRRGATWAEIGEALGMTRQAAFKRFGEVTNPADGRAITGGHMSIEKVRLLTEEVFDLVSTGDYASLEQLLHPEVRSELPESLVAGTWERVLSEMGAKEGYTDTHVVLPGGDRIEEDETVLGTVVGVTTLNLEAGELMGRVAIDDQLRVVGLLIVPVGQQHLPF